MDMILDKCIFQNIFILFSVRYVVGSQRQRGNSNVHLQHMSIQ